MNKVMDPVFLTYSRLLAIDWKRLYTINAYVGWSAVGSAKTERNPNFSGGEAKAFCVKKNGSGVLA